MGPHTVSQVDSPGGHFVAAKLRIPDELRRFCAGQPSVEVEGDSVAAALQSLVTGFPEVGCRVLDESGELRPHLVVIRNGRVLERAGVLQASVAEGDELQLFAAASGG